MQPAPHRSERRASEGAREKESHTFGRKAHCVCVCVCVRSIGLEAKQCAAGVARSGERRSSLCARVPVAAVCIYTCTCSCSGRATRRARSCAFVYARRLAARSYSRRGAVHSTASRASTRARDSPCKRVLAFRRRRFEKASRGTVTDIARHRRARIYRVNHTRPRWITHVGRACTDIYTPLPCVIVDVYRRRRRASRSANRRTTAVVT